MALTVGTPTGIATQVNIGLIIRYLIFCNFYFLNSVIDI
jgi:hypothetical protein